MHCAIFPLTFDLLPHTKVPCYLEHEIVEHFNELSSVFNIVNEGGQPYHYEDEHNSIHGNDTDIPENHGNQTENHGNQTETMATTLVNMNMKKNFVKVSTSL